MLKYKIWCRKDLVIKYDRLNKTPPSPHNSRIFYFIFIELSLVLKEWITGGQFWNYSFMHNTIFFNYVFSQNV